jgi:7-cyano-7-deazaguanine synthase in queuosine biosynthesis
VRTLAICSGGVDSVTMVHKAAVEQIPDYGLGARDACLARHPT